MKPMLLTDTTELPKGKEWLFEVKYDGFRCLLVWKDETPELWSRNGKSLNLMFPEIVNFCEEHYKKIQKHLPLTLDGEIVHLINSVRSDFNTVQKRGRMKVKNTIAEHAIEFPCHFIAFDLLELNGESLADLPLSKRKQQLKEWFKSAKLPDSASIERLEKLQCIDVFQSEGRVWDQVVLGHGEGVIAKKKTSKWQRGKRTDNWLKRKNWRFISVFLTKWDKGNGYFHGAIFKGEELIEVVHVKHGLSKEEEQTLVALFQANGEKASASVWTLLPSVCIAVACIDFDGKHLREPRFHAFQLDKEPEECTWSNMHRELFPLPEKVEITSPDKPVWPKLGIKKDDYLLYLQLIAPHFLPFLKDRVLTVIRYPHGSGEEHFYQKNSPDYAPDFITTYETSEAKHIICNDIETLLWLGNQLALEFHIPFQTIHTTCPTEIVFDLDPPSVEEFSLAKKAALRMKAIFDQFNLASFVKTSGGKGIQVYIPLPVDAFTYEETRVFTSFVCTFLCEQEPQWFTTERLKKNRGNRLYLDYIQHDEGKTIIAPYSPRGNEKALIATPLNWDEIDDTLTPDRFTMPAVLERLKNQSNPFRSIRHSLNPKPLQVLLEQLNGARHPSR